MDLKMLRISEIQKLCRNVETESLQKKSLLNQLNQEMRHIQDTLLQRCAQNEQVRSRDVNMVAMRQLLEASVSIQRRLISLSDELKLITMEDSRQHRYLRSLLSRFHHKVYVNQQETETYSQEKYEQLMSTITGVCSTYEKTLRLKEDSDNIYNTAKCQLDALQKYISDYYDYAKLPVASRKTTRGHQDDRTKTGHTQIRCPLKEINR